MPTKEEFTFLSKNGKTQIHAVRWLPDTTEYRAVLQITHGMIEYIDRYDAFASYLASLGFLVVGHDHLGHGASVETEKDWGYFADQPSDTVIADMNTLRSLTAKEHPGLPYFMLGHSMGSYMLRKYLSIYGTGLAGAVIMGTGYIPDSQVKIAIRAVTASAKIHGWDYHSDLVRKLTFGKPYHRYDLTGADAGNSWLTKDEKIVRLRFPITRISGCLRQSILTTGRRISQRSRKRFLCFWFPARMIRSEIWERACSMYTKNIRKRVFWIPAANFMRTTGMRY